MTDMRKRAIADYLDHFIISGYIEPNRIDCINIDDDGQNVRIILSLKPLEAIDFVSLSIDFTPKV